MAIGPSPRPQEAEVGDPDVVAMGLNDDDDPAQQRADDRQRRAVAMLDQPGENEDGGDALGYSPGDYGDASAAGMGGNQSEDEGEGENKQETEGESEADAEELKQEMQSAIDDARWDDAMAAIQKLKDLGYDGGEVEAYVEKIAP